MITVYEANVTDMGEFLTALQPRNTDRPKRRWLARGETSARRTGQVLRVWEGGPAASAYLDEARYTVERMARSLSCSGQSLFSDKALIMDGPSAVPVSQAQVD